ncbi:MAG: COX15/CtaA family protein, partial [Acidobacteriota bacterium]
MVEKAQTELRHAERVLKSDSSIENFPTRRLHRFALLVALMTLILLVAGGLVTSNEAGDSVPDWPLSFGRWLIHSDYFVANIRYEYSHRFIAGMVGLSTFFLALWVWRSDLRAWMRKLAWAAFAGVVAQALLGGARVLMGEGGKPFLAVPHALVAQSFFGTIVAIAVFTSRSWWATDSRTVDARTARLTLYSVVAVLMQLVLGAGFRHRAFGIIPHIIGAVIVAALLLWTVMTVMARHKERLLRRPAATAIALLMTQLLLGVSAYLARLAAADDPQPLEPMISLTVAHMTIGALLLADLIVLMLRCYGALSDERAEKVFAAPHAESA